MPARNADGASRPTISAIQAAPGGPLFKMEQETSSPRLNTPTSGRMRMRGTAAPPWLRDCKPTGIRIHEAPLTVEPTKEAVQLARNQQERGGGLGGQNGGGSGGEEKGVCDSGGASLVPATAVIGKTGPLKSRADRQRKKPLPLQTDGSSIPSMRGGGWTPRWEALQVTVPPLNALDSRNVLSSVAKGRPRPGGLQLSLDPQSETRTDGKVVATSIRSSHDTSTSDERVYYKFSPRRTRFAQTAMSIASGSPR